MIIFECYVIIFECYVIIFECFVIIFECYVIIFECYVIILYVVLSFLFPVERASCQMCERSHDVPHYALLTMSQGYIASWVTKQQENGCGSGACPWLIEAQAGQKINITLLDFSDKSKLTRNTWVPNTCNRFGVIKEDAAPSDTPICKGQERERHLYTSVSHSVEIHVVSPEVLTQAGQFLLYYQGTSM